MGILNNVRLRSSPAQPNLAGSVAAAREALEEGRSPSGKLIAASHAQCP